MVDPGMNFERNVSCSSVVTDSCTKSTACFRTMVPTSRRFSMLSCGNSSDEPSSIAGVVVVFSCVICIIKTDNQHGQ